MFLPLIRLRSHLQLNTVPPTQVFFCTSFLVSYPLFPFVFQYSRFSMSYSSFACRPKGSHLYFAVGKRPYTKRSHFFSQETRFKLPGLYYFFFPVPHFQLLMWSLFFVCQLLFFPFCFNSRAFFPGALYYLCIRLCRYISFSPLFTLLDLYASTPASACLFSFAAPS